MTIAQKKEAMSNFDFFKTDLEQADPEVYSGIRKELGRQQDQIELIASENIVSRAVLQAQGSVLTNKYAEGYPGKRYYGGCEQVDIVETLAIERAKALFGAEHANVQPHSGAQANMAVFVATLQPGDTILGMNLAHGGHLTHGHPLNFSGKYFNVVAYGVRKDDERIDYDEVARVAREHKPKLIIAGASAYPRVIDFPRFRAIADEVGAAGLVCLGYPFHPVGEPGRLRVAHLADMRTPALIVQGTRDPFGTRAEVEGYRLAPSVTVRWVEDGDHDLRPRRASGRTKAQNWAEAVAAVGEFVAAL